MPPFTIFSSHVIRTSRGRLGKEDAGSAEAHCIRPATGANHVGVYVVWGHSTTGASASAARAMAAEHANPASLYPSMRSGCQRRCSSASRGQLPYRLVTIAALQTRGARDGRAGRRQTSSRTVGAPALFRDRAAIGGTSTQGRARRRHCRTRRAYLASPDLERAHPLRLLHDRALVLPGLEGEEGSRRSAAPQAARRCRPAASDERRRRLLPTASPSYCAALTCVTRQLKTRPRLQGWLAHCTWTSLGKLSNCRSDDPNDRVCPLGTAGLAVPDACPTILQFVSFVLSSQSFKVTCTSKESSVYLVLFETTPSSAMYGP